MKKILAVLLLLTSACSAQVEHSGLTIPGDGAVQVVRKNGKTAPKGALIFLRWQDYDQATGSTALWPNAANGLTYPASESYGFYQTVETKKPLLSGNAVFAAQAGDDFLYMNLTGTQLSGTDKSYTYVFRARFQASPYPLGQRFIAFDNNVGRGMIVNTNSKKLMAAPKTNANLYESNDDMITMVDSVYAYSHDTTSETTGVLTFYKDGAPFGTANTVGTTAGSAMFFMGYSSAGYAMGAYVKYFMAYDRVLTQEEITQATDYLWSLP